VRQERDEAPAFVSDPEIAAEQAYLDRAHERLDAMREAARAVSSEVLALGAGGTFANRVERDVRVELSERRLAQLRVGDASVCFGRLDMADDDERFYVGRIGISDEEGDPLVVDWRAPVAEPFYRATPAEPLGVVRRRHFMFRGRRLTGIDDELLDRQAAGNDDLVLMGEGALIAGLERGRTGRMADIVATIQAEQDAVIRSDLAGALVVQGGAGTGKTAVALHRAAYLLFSHRVRLEREGVLLVGPNTVFLRYIEQVLPSLGEYTVTLATPAALYAGSARPTGTDAPAVAALKGDRRMVDVLAEAVRTRERPLRKAVEVEFRGQRVVIGREESRQLVAAIQSTAGTHNSRRAVLEQRLSRLLFRAWRRAAEAAAAAGRRSALTDADRAEAAEELSSELRRIPAVREALERMWPVLSPEQLLNDLFGTPPLLRRAAERVLRHDEIVSLQRARAGSEDTVSWTEADIPLLDEAATLLGPRRAARSQRARRRRGETGEDDSWMLDRATGEQLPDCPVCGSQLTWQGGSRPWSCERCGRDFASDQVLSPGEQATLFQLRGRVGQSFSPSVVVPPPKGARFYGHAVVDEAQTLSAMQWRSLARRVPSGSFTIAGDLGQASGAGSPQRWEDVLDLLPGRSRARVEELTVNYRTPAEVMEVAVPVLALAAPELSPPRSARRSGARPEVTETRSLGPAVATAAAAERHAIGDGKVAVIAPAALVAELAAHLEAPHAGSEALSSGEADRILDAPLAVLSVAAARGLEFDSVVLVEPAAIVSEEAVGLRALYVAMTRTTRRLHIVHAEALPPVLAAAVAETESQSA
jgi:DNA helicase IV